jgi:hypothetical protein
MTALKFHPLADIFPLMEGAEFDELVADIKANGLREKIDLYQGRIVDGRNRYLALQRLGIDPSADQKQYFRKAIYAHTTGGEIAPHERNNDDRVRAYVISKNIHRRHLTAEQKRAYLPEKSNRQIAKTAKVDDKTVGAVRRELESTAEIPRLEKTIGADGKARKQPARKKKKHGTTYWLEGVDGRSTPQRVSGAVFRAHAAQALAAHTEVALEEMDDGQRAEFFALLWDKFRDELIAAQTISYERAVPPKPGVLPQRERPAAGCRCQSET